MHPMPIIRLVPWTFVLAAGLLAGCNPGIKMIGTWQVDSEKLRATVEKESSGNPLASLAAGMLSVVEVQVEFKADGTVVASGSGPFGNGTAQGSWRYLKTDGDDMVLSVKADNDSAEREVRVRFVDWDHVEMAPPIGLQGITGSGTFPFKRVKKE